MYCVVCVFEIQDMGFVDNQTNVLVVLDAASNIKIFQISEEVKNDVTVIV